MLCRIVMGAPVGSSGTESDEQRGGMSVHDLTSLAVNRHVIHDVGRKDQATDRQQEDGQNRRVDTLLPRRSRQGDPYGGSGGLHRSRRRRGGDDQANEKRSRSQPASRSTLVVLRRLFHRNDRRRLDRLPVEKGVSREPPIPNRGGRFGDTGRGRLGTRDAEQSFKVKMSSQASTITTLTITVVGAGLIVVAASVLRTGSKAKP